MDAMEQRLRILAEASHEFADATADYERLIDLVARRLAASVKDGCVVRLLSDDGWLVPAAIHLPVQDRIVDPVIRARVGAAIASRQRVTHQGSLGRVFDTGEAMLIAHIDLAEMRAHMPPEIYEATEVLGIHSMLLVPLRVRRETIGTLSLVRCTTAAPFDDADRDLAQVLGDHAALAISNARLLRQAQIDQDARIKAEFLARMSHELRTPLNAILGFSELLRDGVTGALTTEQTEFVDQVLASGRQLLAFIDELLQTPRP